MRISTNLIKTVAVISLLMIPTVALAVAGGSGLNYNTNPLGTGVSGGGLFDQILGCTPAVTGTVLCILETTLKFILTISFIIAVIFLVIGGFRYMTAAGNEDAIESAKGTITSAIIGVVVIAVAYFILNLVLQIAYSGTP